MLLVISMKGARLNVRSSAMVNIPTMQLVGKQETHYDKNELVDKNQIKIGHQHL